MSIASSLYFVIFVTKTTCRNDSSRYRGTADADLIAATAHVLGWLLLGLAAFAPPRESRQEPRSADSGPGVAAPAAGAHDVRAAAPVPVATSVAVISSVVQGPDIVDGVPPPTLAGEPVTAPARRGPGPPADAAPPLLARPALAVREFAPGSKAHAEALAQGLASEEFQDVVTPLARLYLAYFGRVPDYEGFDYYIGERERGESLDAIADEFAGSAEFEARYGALDNAAFVDRVLQNVFGLPGDAQDGAYWVDQLESGRLTRGQVMLIFSESAGYRATTANEVFVAIAYAQTLARAPDPADLARWVRFLEAGNPRRAVIDGLLAGRGKG